MPFWMNTKDKKEAPKLAQQVHAILDRICLQLLDGAPMAGRKGFAAKLAVTY